MGGQHCGGIKVTALAEDPDATAITFRNNRLMGILGSKARRHDGLNKIIVLGKINPKSAAQAEYQFFEYLGHNDLLNTHFLGCCALCH
jgi:hypothetical protein